jgi:hypothetical protein
VLSAIINVNAVLTRGDNCILLKEISFIGALYSFHPKQVCAFIPNNQIFPDGRIAYAGHVDAPEIRIKYICFQYNGISGGSAIPG